MELLNSYVVEADLDTAWRTLQDVQGLAPCMPGATLESVDGDRFTGNVKVKLGPVSMVYGGEARFVSRDEASRTVVIEGAGKETRGSGTAQVLVTATLVPESAVRTRVDVVTELTITGKAAQFGRGVMQDVAGRIIDTFSANLASTMAADEADPDLALSTDDGSGDPAPRLSAVPAPQAADSINLLESAGAPVLKRVAPIVIGLAALALVVWVARRPR